MVESQNVSILLMLFIFVTYTQQQLKDPAYMAKWSKAKADCAAEEGINPADATKAWNDNSFPEDNNKLKCYYKCVNVKLGILDENGEVVDDELGKFSSQISTRATEQEVVEECGPLKGADLCETALKLTACIKAAVLD